MATARTPQSDKSSDSFFARFVSNVKKLVAGSFESQVKTGRTALDMPVLPLAPLQTSVMACSTGPCGGLCQLDPELDAPTHERGVEIAGITHWQRPQLQADGQSITLYEHKTGSTQHHGDPIADVYAVVARPNSCILAVADGVNWGMKPRLAARCAVHGCIDYLNSKLFNCPKVPGTTQDVFHHILRSFHSAQKLIIQHGGTTTTLCVAVVVELQPAKGNSKWGVCVVCVGDTLCYIWRKETQQVHEITSATHLGKERNPRDSGGCLGCDLGDQPDLSNLLCCFVPISEDDIIFVVSDGVSDNMDPVLLKEAVSDTGFSPSSTPIIEVKPSIADGNSISQDLPESPQLPVVTPEQRQARVLARLSSLLREKYDGSASNLTAMGVKDALITSVIENTEEKRAYLEQCWQEQESAGMTVSQRRANDRKIGKKVRTLPGKLDHATVAAYRVGRCVVSDEQLVKRGHSATHSHVMNTAVTRTPINRHSKSFATTGGSIFYFNPKINNSQETCIPGSEESLPKYSFPEHTLPIQPFSP